MTDRSRSREKRDEARFPHSKEFPRRILLATASFPLAYEGGDGDTTRRRGGDFAAQGGFSHSHLCRHRATTWYPRPGVPQSINDGTSLPSSSLAEALPSPPSPPSLLLPPPPSATSSSSSSIRVLSVKRTTVSVDDKCVAYRSMSLRKEIFSRSASFYRSIESTKILCSLFREEVSTHRHQSPSSPFA